MRRMRPLVRIFAIAICCASFVRADDACPNSVLGQSADIPDLSWATGVGKFGGRICTRQRIATKNQDRPLAVEWPGAGIISAEVGGRLTSSFCCFEQSQTKAATLKYGAPRKEIETRIDSGIENDSEEYPDLIEEDARTMRSSYTGKLWDGSEFVDIDIEFRSAASYPHLNQSVIQFILIDRSPQRLKLSWDLQVNLSKTMAPYYTGGEEGGRWQDIYVFFGKKRPAPARGVVEVRTAEGKPLARFTAAGFMPEEAAGKGK
jgi:hypothetical protein